MVQAEQHAGLVLVELGQALNHGGVARCRQSGALKGGETETALLVANRRGARTEAPLG